MLRGDDDDGDALTLKGFESVPPQQSESSLGAPTGSLDSACDPIAYLWDSFPHDFSMKERDDAEREDELENEEHESEDTERDERWRRAELSSGWWDDVASHAELLSERQLEEVLGVLNSFRSSLEATVSWV